MSVFPEITLHSITKDQHPLALYARLTFTVKLRLPSASLGLSQCPWATGMLARSENQMSDSDFSER